MEKEADPLKVHQEEDHPDMAVEVEETQEEDHQDDWNHPIDGILHEEIPQ